MNEAVQFLLDNKVFYIATMQDDQPKVRPFGFVMEYEGKIYFCTGNQKEFYRQCMKNPNTEICACAPDGSWVRITGKAVFDGNMAAKQKVMEISPGVKGIYQTADNPIFEVFYLEDAQATFYGFSDQPKTIRL